MRKLILLMLTLVTIFALGACAQTGTTQAGASTESPVKTPIQQPTMPPVSGVKPPFDIGPIREYLARQLDLPVEQITLTFWQAVEWRDGCLGVHKPNEMCTDVITPGFALTFRAGQNNYAVNTDATGQNYRLAQDTSTLDQLPAVSWTRSGGFAGVCQNLTVYSSGNYWLRDCKTDKILAQGVLPEGHLTYLSGLWERFGTFEWNTVLPSGSADMFSDQIIFYGRGGDVMPAEEQQNLNQYLAQLVNELEGLTLVASGITGQVMIGPTCGGPVKADPGTECADKPYQATITVLDQAGQVVIRFTTDTEGRFNVPLQPGAYTLKPEMSGAMAATVEQQIVVVSGQFLTVAITYDSGIR